MIVRTSRHEDTANNQQLPIMSPEHTQQPEDDTSASEDAKSNWNTAHADSYGIVAVDVEALGGPEHQHGEEVGAGDEGDD